VICFNYRHLGDSSCVHHDRTYCWRLQQQPWNSSSRRDDDDERLGAAGNQATSFQQVRSLQVGKLTPPAKTC